MRIKALLTTLLLGSTFAGVASAAPIVRDHRNQSSYQQPVYSHPASTQATVSYGFQVGYNGSVQPYTYGQDPWIEHLPRSSWSDIADRVRFAPQGFAGIALNGRPTRAIELQSDRGRVQIERVRIELKNGTVINVTPSRELDRREPNLRVDLGPGAASGVVRVIVYGQGGGSFRLLAA